MRRQNHLFLVFSFLFVLLASQTNHLLSTPVFLFSFFYIKEKVILMRYCERAPLANIRKTIDEELRSLK